MNKKPSVESYGQAHTEAYDPKKQRTKHVETLGWCGKCRCFSGHRDGCEDDTLEAAKKREARSIEKEKWARERASFWLDECRKMHGKLAMLKAELKKLRKKATPGDSKD